MLQIIGVIISYIVIPIILVIQMVSNFFQKKFRQPFYHFKSQYFYKRISNFDTEYSKVQKRSKSDGHNNQHEKDVTIVFIPGNPGFVRFYDYYLNELANFLDHKYNIYAVCHSGHLGYVKKGRKYINETDYIKQKESPNQHTNSNVQNNETQNLNERNKTFLDQQVDHKVEFMKYLMHKHPNTQFIFISHSIGSYMVLNLLDRIPKEKILHSYKLFPTFERMNEAPNFKRANILTKQLASYIISIIAHIIQYLPNFLKRIIAQIFLQSSNQQEPINDIIETITQFLDYHTVQNISKLAQCEFAQVRKRQDSLFKKYLNDITLLYGQTDGWVPLDYYHQIKQDIPGIDAKLDTTGLEHAFIVGGSKSQAKLQAQWITDVIDKKSNKD